MEAHKPFDKQNIAVFNNQFVIKPAIARAWFQIQYKIKWQAFKRPALTKQMMKKFIKRRTELVIKRFVKF